MKIKNIQGIICLIIFSLFANQVWAEDWMLYASPNDGNMYYDKSNIQKVDKNITRVWIKIIYNKKGKAETYSVLKSIGKAPQSPDMVSHQSRVEEIDCINEKIKSVYVNFYDEKGDAFYLVPSSFGKWRNIVPNSHIETLKNIVCGAVKTSKTEKK
jgi:hypothetical protein